jgi:hypothetical protein
LRGLVVEPVLALEFRCNRLLELGNSIDGGVFGLATPDRCDCRFLDIVGRVEIGLARRQADNIAALPLERHCLV